MKTGWEQLVSLKAVATPIAQAAALSPTPSDRQGAMQLQSLGKKEPRARARGSLDSITAGPTTGDAEPFHQTQARIQPVIAVHPLALGQWLQALAYTLSKPRKIAINGIPEAADTQSLSSVVCDGYRPFQVVALGSPDGLQLTLTRQLPSKAAGGYIAAVPLLRDRGRVDGQVAAYVYRDFACHTPGIGPDALQALLETG